MDVQFNNRRVLSDCFQRTPELNLFLVGSDSKDVTERNKSLHFIFTMSHMTKTQKTIEFKSSPWFLAASISYPAKPIPSPIAQ